MIYLVEADGTYVGAYSENSAPVPVNPYDDANNDGGFIPVAPTALDLALKIPGRISVPLAPGDASQKWDGKQWGAPAPVAVAPSLQDVLLKKGLITAADLAPVAVIAAPVAQIDKSA